MVRRSVIASPKTKKRITAEAQRLRGKRQKKQKKQQKKKKKNL